MAAVTPLPTEPSPEGGRGPHASAQGDAGAGVSEAEKGGFAQVARRPAIIATLVAMSLVAVALSDAGSELETTIARPIEFRARSLLGREPELAPSVKVFAFEDRSASASGYTDFPLDDWSRVLTAMAAAKPRTILVDKTFAHPLGRRGLTTFTSRLAQEGIPLVAKAHVTGLELRHLEALPLDQFAKPHDGFIHSTRRPGMATRKPLWMSSKVFHAYGPVHALLPAFHAIGHNAAVDHGHLAPVVNVAGNRSLLHWSLYAAAAQGIVDGDLNLDGKLVPLDAEGRIPVNLVPFSRLLARTRSLVSALEDAKSGNAVTGVEAGDTIVILPDMYTGVIDFEDTAIGRMPVGFITLSVVNSVVSGQWLSVLGGYAPLAVLFSFAGAALSLFWRRKHLLVAAASGAVLMGIAGVATFSFAGMIVPWLLPACGFLAALGLSHVDQMRSYNQRAALLKRDLNGFLAPEKLEKILDKSALHRFDATEQVVTIMFIDIVGFSRAAEKQTPKEAFSSLKSLVDALRTTVHEFGGDVDRTMGDGMLCVFGYDFEGKQQAPVHADQAVQCAAKIQHDNLKRIMKAQKTGKAVFPLRVGINTTNVYLGNLGNAEKVDFTVIGNGVNFAQRLEAACDRHMVMIGASTADMLSPFDGKDDMIRKRHIRVKHSEELVEAYELDPFHNDPQLLLDGDEAYRVFTGVERSDTRWPLPYPGLIKVLTNYGDGDLVNFSVDGFTIKLPGYYAKDVAISMKMDSLDGALGERLERAGLLPIIVEVRWARPAGDGYIHGCQIKNLTQEHRNDIINMLRDSLHRYVAEKRAG